MKVVIEGAGEVGSHLAKLLRAEGHSITVIDSDPERLAHLSVYADVETVEGSASSLRILEQAGAGTADLYIAEWRCFQITPRVWKTLIAGCSKKINN